jgi:hypothetical protein
MFGVGVGVRVGGFTASSGGNFDPDAQAFFDRVTTAGGTLTTIEKNATNQLVLDMKSAGIWTSMKAIYPMVGSSAAACAQNLKSSSFTGTFTSGWTFASTGVTPNGTSAYMDTNLIPSSNMSNSSASMGFANNVANTNSSGIEFGVQSAVDGMSIWTQFSSSAVSRIGRGADASFPIGYSTAGRLYGSRTTSTLQTLYRNGVSVATGTGAVTPLETVYTITLGGLNLSGTPNLFANGRYTFAFIGDGLSGTNITNLDSAIVTFNTSLSR